MKTAYLRVLWVHGWAAMTATLFSVFCSYFKWKLCLKTLFDGNKNKLCCLRLSRSLVSFQSPTHRVLWSNELYTTFKWFPRRFIILFKSYSSSNYICHKVFQKHPYSQQAAPYPNYSPKNPFLSQNKPSTDGLCISSRNRFLKAFPSNDYFPKTKRPQIREWQSIIFHSNASVALPGGRPAQSQCQSNDHRELCIMKSKNWLIC